jgi:hypothetical protein
MKTKTTATKETTAKWIHHSRLGIVDPGMVSGAVYMEKGTGKLYALQKMPNFELWILVALPESDPRMSHWCAPSKTAEGAFGGCLENFHRCIARWQAGHRFLELYSSGLVTDHGGDTITWDYFYRGEKSGGGFDRVSADKAVEEMKRTEVKAMKKDFPSTRCTFFHSLDCKTAAKVGYP